MKNVQMLYKSDRRKNWKFEEGKMRISTLIFINTIHFAYLKVYTKFHNPKWSSCWENSDKNVHMYIYEEWQKEKLKKKAKWALASLFSFTQYT